MTVRFELPPVSSVRWGPGGIVARFRTGITLIPSSQKRVWGARHDLAGCQLHAFEENSGAARADAVRGESLHDLVESADTSSRGELTSEKRLKGREKGRFEAGRGLTR